MVPNVFWLGGRYAVESGAKSREISLPEDGVTIRKYPLMRRSKCSPTPLTRVDSPSWVEKKNLFTKQIIIIPMSFFYWTWWTLVYEYAFKERCIYKHYFWKESKQTAICIKMWVGKFLDSSRQFIKFTPLRIVFRIGPVSIIDIEIKSEPLK